MSSSRGRLVPKRVLDPYCPFTRSRPAGLYLYSSCSLGQCCKKALQFLGGTRSPRSEICISTLRPLPSPSVCVSA